MDIFFPSEESSFKIETKSLQGYQRLFKVTAQIHSQMSCQTIFLLSGTKIPIQPDLAFQPNLTVSLFDTFQRTFLIKLWKSCNNLS